jgi:hypothetical protein
MGRRSKAFQRRRRKNTNATGTKADVAWWNPMGIKANANVSEISRLIREDLAISVANELRESNIPWDSVLVSVPASTVADVADLCRQHSELIKGERHEKT